MTLDNILEEINKAESIVILTHENPDGDAVGSSLALYNALKIMVKMPMLLFQNILDVLNFYQDVVK